MQLFCIPNITKLKAKNKVKGLIKALSYKKNAAIRQDAAKHLESLHWNPSQDKFGAFFWIEKCEWDKCVTIGSKAVKPLIVTLNDKEVNEEIRLKAVETLGLIACPKVVKSLILILEKENETLSIASAKALGMIGDDRAINPLIATLYDEYSSEFANTSIESLVKIGSPAVKALIPLLKNESDSARKRAATALGDIGAPEAVKSLIAPFKDTSSYVHDAAFEALVKIGAPAFEPLSLLLNDSDKSIRCRAVRALGKVGDVRAVKLLLTTLKSDKITWVCEAAAEALIQYNDKEVVKSLLTFLQEKHEPWVKIFINKLQSEIREELSADDIRNIYWIINHRWEQCDKAGGAIQKLFKSLITINDVPMYYKEVASKKLANIDPPSGQETLISFIRNGDWQIRNAAIYGLNEIGWKPKKRHDRTAYLISIGDLNHLSILKSLSVDVLVESLDWQMELHDSYIKGRIAKLLLRPNNKIDNLLREKATKHIEIYAKKCSDELDNIKLSPHTYFRRNIEYFKIIFEEYTELIVDCMSFHESSSGDGSGGSFSHHDTKSSLIAVRNLCKIKTPTCSNILHHISRLKDIEVVTGTFEVPYSSENSSGMSRNIDKLSFKSHRNVAIRELIRRGNPNYDLSIYKTESCWQLPKV